MKHLSGEKTYALFSSAANKKLIGDLEKTGAMLFRFPPLETEKNNITQTNVEHLQKISDFDWIIFTDVFTVEYFLQALEETDVDLFEMDAVRVCALGEAVSDALRFVQLHADVIPNSLETEEIFSAITDYLYENELEGLKFLVVREASQTFELAEKLKEASACVFELSVYRATTSQQKEIVRLKTLLGGGAIDEFVFSSPADFAALRFYFGGESIADLLAEIKVSATSEIVFQTAKEFNLRPLYFHL